MSYEAIRIFIENMIHNGDSNDKIIQYFMDKDLKTKMNNRKRVYAVRFLYEARK